MEELCFDLCCYLKPITGAQIKLLLCQVVSRRETRVFVRGNALANALVSAIANVIESIFIR